MKKHIAIFVVLCCAVTLLRANAQNQSETLASVISALKPGESVKCHEVKILEAVVVSDWRSPNVALNPNVTYDRVDMGMNRRTAYVQESDGTQGAKIIFNSSSDNALEQFDRVCIDLNGATLTLKDKPRCLIIENLGVRNVLSCVHGTAGDVMIKEKYIDELQDSDLYTLVSLKECEMAFREGSYTNIWEPYSQYVKDLHEDFYGVNGRMDGWASMLRDTRGRSIYMLVNTLCTWRRDGAGVPQGVGPVEGVIVEGQMPRYSDNMGRYCIRPLDKSAIRIPKKGKSAWKTLTGWYLDGEAGNMLEFELMGEVRDVFKMENRKKGDRVLSDRGVEAFLWTDSGAAIGIENDINALSAHNKGAVKNGAIVFNVPVKNWWTWDSSGQEVTGYHYIYMEFPTKRAKGSHLMLTFEWAAGTIKPYSSYNFPLDWRVEYSTDGGKTFTKVKDLTTGGKSFELKSLPYWDGAAVEKAAKGDFKYNTGFWCGLGMQQRAFELGPEAMGKDKVIVRIGPANRNIMPIRKAPANTIRTYKVQPSMNTMTFIRFGTISVDYR